MCVKLGTPKVHYYKDTKTESFFSPFVIRDTAKNIKTIRIIGLTGTSVQKTICQFPHR